MKERNHVRREDADEVCGWVRVKAADLKTAEAQIRTSVSKDDTRPVLTGVLVSVVEDRVRMVATDSYRLAIKESELLSSDDAELQETLIPARALQCAVRIARARESVEVAVSQTAVIFRLVDMELVAPLIIGKFPDYRRLFPDGYGHTVVAPKADFLAALERIRPPRRRNGLPAPVQLTISDGFLELRAEDEEAGQSHETIEAASPDTGEQSIAFNPGYLADGVKAVTSDAVRLQFNEPMKPALITPATWGGGREPGYRYLLMPMPA